MVDEVKLFEIINNLLSNALKFTESGFVSLNVQLTLLSLAELPRAKLEIHVRDSGPGIPVADRTNVFVPFFQRNDDPKQHVGGTGLGLAIVKELVSLLGGQVHLDSELGQGSDFHVLLFVELAPSEAASTTTVSTPISHHSGSSRTNSGPEAFHGLRMLLVDDNELNAFLASKVMESLGFTVVLADNGAAGVDAFARSRFDVVLMDCQMPVMDGYAATLAIREHEARSGIQRTPVIAVTAYTLAGDRREVSGGRHGRLPRQALYRTGYQSETVALGFGA